MSTATNKVINFSMWDSPAPGTHVIFFFFKKITCVPGAGESRIQNMAEIGFPWNVFKNIPVEVAM